MRIPGDVKKLRVHRHSAAALQSLTRVPGRRDWRRTDVPGSDPDRNGKLGKSRSHIGKGGSVLDNGFARAQRDKGILIRRRKIRLEKEVERKKEFRGRKKGHSLPVTFDSEGSSSREPKTVN